MAEAEIAGFGVDDAVLLAKQYVRDVYKHETIQNIGLEEVVHDYGDTWSITIGFSRPWDRHPLQTLMPSHANPSPRDYKVVEIDGRDRSVKSLRNRDTR